MTAVAEILDGGKQQIGAVSEHPQTDVARAAEDATNSTGRVVMVDDEAGRGSA